MFCWLLWLTKTFRPKEGAVLEEIRKSVEAKKGQLNAAKKIVEAESYAFRKTGSLKRASVVVA